MSEENSFSNGPGTVRISGRSKIVHHHFSSLNNIGNNFIYEYNGNSTVIEGSISNSSCINYGELHQYFGTTNISLVNISKCESNVGSAIHCLMIQYSSNVMCCCIESCNSEDYSAIYFQEFIELGKIR